MPRRWPNCAPRRRIALTGTPIENGVRDLWSMFRFIQPGWLGRTRGFPERYELPLAAGESAAAVMERLQLKIPPFLLRRTKEQVAPDLPSKLFIDEFCDLSSDQQAVYHEFLVEGRKRVDAIADSGNPGAARMQMLTALLRLRQTCCDLALFGNEHSIDCCAGAALGQTPTSAWNCSKRPLNGNHRVLSIQSVPETITGNREMRFRARLGAVCGSMGRLGTGNNWWTNSKSPHGPPVFLISLKAGGYGLNLTAADTVFTSIHGGIRRRKCRRPTVPTGSGRPGR